MSGEVKTVIEYRQFKLENEFSVRLLTGRALFGYVQGDDGPPTTLHWSDMQQVLQDAAF